MSRSFTLNQLTEGIRDRNVGAEGNRLMEKWTRTGLLRGLADTNREIMSRLLENQAAQVLREANTLGSAGNAGAIDGFSNIAFPIVRRVFGGLVIHSTTTHRELRFVQVLMLLVVNTTLLVHLTQEFTKVLCLSQCATHKTAHSVLLQHRFLTLLAQQAHLAPTVSCFSSIRRSQGKLIVANSHISSCSYQHQSLLILQASTHQTDLLLSRLHSSLLHQSPVL